ncbi:MAG: hypothetical protein NTW13_03210, partial [Candidatus Omnitrophica bacterium]|nr:hypothetical protein [Candidatus Omnitrophota bacterium]
KKGFTKNICPACLKNRLHFDRAFAPCIYDGVIKDLIHEFKYKNKEHLGLPLSEIMSGFIKEYSLPIDYLDLIIPIPLHKVRMREREFNQAQVLSGHLALEFNKPLLKDTLRRLRHTKTQTELNLNQRWLNVKGKVKIYSWLMMC